MSTLLGRGLTVTYGGSLTHALSNVDIDVPQGRFTAIIGPNGSGKSTLIRVLLGALRADHGTAHFDGRDVHTYSRAELSRSIGAVTQIEEMPFPVTVRELVATGRYSHLGAWRAERAIDRSAVLDALARCDITDLADRSIAAVSGGERQRARIARALAQQPSTLVLDEPTAALDIAHEMSIFQLLRSLAKSGVTVLIATHHINHAARFADQLVLLDRGAIAAAGSPADVMQQDVLERVYGWPLQIYPYPGPGFDHGAPQIAALSQSPSA